MAVCKSLMVNYGKIIMITLLITAVLLEMLVSPVQGTIAYQFPRYTYKKKPKFPYLTFLPCFYAVFQLFLERFFKQEWRKCELTRECEQMFGVERTRCIRICLAPICHDEIYSYDELEEGEIDVRATSFKGCWRQRYHEFGTINRVDL
ncbi:uncharacterized protein [Amphiura filiformis]|uniref:uncharacterized protein n=1 Tax=Amphiura filiformis TaxID=82378 RepID=UPI003B21828D